MLKPTRATEMLGQKPRKHINPTAAKLNFVIFIFAESQNRLTNYVKLSEEHCHTHILAILSDFVKPRACDDMFVQ